MLNPAQCEPSDVGGRPNRTFLIFEESSDGRSSQRVVPSQPPILPACQTLIGADPQRSVSGGKQAENVIRREALIHWWFPRPIAHAVETEQTELSAKPQITVWRLSNGINSAFGETVTNLPSRVDILTHIQPCIQSERRSRRQQHSASDCDAQHAVSRRRTGTRQGTRHPVCTRNLELKFERELNRARPADLVKRAEAAALSSSSQRIVQHLRGLPELWGAEVVDRTAKIWMVQDVKEVHASLERETTRHSELTAQRHIPLRRAESPQGVPP